MVTRRGFLGALVIAPFVRPVITGFKPRPRITFDQINAITLRHILPAVRNTYFNDGPFLRYLGRT